MEPVLFPNRGWQSRNDGQRAKYERLLGPQGHELSCEECFVKLDRDLELELQGSEADARTPGMREHLEGCSACAEDHLSLRALVQAEAC